MMAVGPAAGQNAEDPDFLSNPTAVYNQIVAFLNSGSYEKGLALTDGLIHHWGARGKEEFGPGFGHFHYLRGVLLMASESYGEAANSFRTCYEEFPNELINSEGLRERPKLANRFLVHALAQWGACLMITGNYPEAIEKLKLALEKSSATRIRTDAIALNLARSLLRNGELAEGKELILKALASTTLPAEMKRKAFMILVEDWTPGVPFEQVLPFLWDYGELLRNDTPNAQWERNPVFAHLAREALKNEEPLRALTWYGFLLNPQERISHWEIRIAELGKVVPDDAAARERLSAGKREAETELARARDGQAALLLGVGSGHFQLGNVSAAYAAFREVSDHHPDHPQWPDAVYNLIASCAYLARWGEIRGYGNEFLERYPEHSLVAEVARLMAESIYLLGEWGEARQTGVALRDRFPRRDVAADVPDYVAAASLFHLGNHEDAASELDTYLKRYAKPRRAEPATYYLGASKMHLFKWKEGVEVLEKFEEDFPDSSLRPSALLQAALGRFALGELDEASAKAERLRNDWPSAKEVAASWNLTADILLAQGEVPLEAILGTYEKGRELASADPALIETAAYSVWKQIALQSGARNHDAVIALYDDFRTSFPGSGHEIDAIAGAVRSLAEKGRHADAVAALQEQILRFANDPGSSLGEIFGTWLAFLKDRNDVGAVLSLVRHFPAPTDDPAPLRAWLTISEIELMEGLGDETHRDTIDNLYFKIQLDLPRESVSNYPLVKLARWNVARSDTVKAREILEFIIKTRPLGEHIEMVMSDLAGLLATSESETDRNRALAYYAEVRERFDMPLLQEAATLGGGRLLMRQGRHKEALNWWGTYLRREEWVSSRPEANFQFGRCLEETGKPNEALKLYVSVYVNFPGHLDWSTQAYLRTADILKRDRKDADALLVMVDMLKRLGSFDHPNVRIAREQFARWKAEWVARNPSGS